MVYCEGGTFKACLSGNLEMGTYNYLISWAKIGLEAVTSMGGEGARRAEAGRQMSVAMKWQAKKLPTRHRDYLE